MIQPNELRIGNKIINNGCIDTATGIFHEMHDKNDLYWIQAENKLDYFLENIEPIELSSDILLKAGFIFDGDNVFELNGVQIGTSKSGFVFLQEYRSNQFFVYQYLHQVQNLYFALTATELHINI